MSYLPALHFFYNALLSRPDSNSSGMRNLTGLAPTRTERKLMIAWSYTFLTVYYGPSILAFITKFRQSLTRRRQQHRNQPDPPRPDLGI